MRGSQIIKAAVRRFAGVNAGVSLVGNELVIPSEPVGEYSDRLLG